jgi:hypothetical protein
MRVKKVKIYKMMDIIIVEKNDGNRLEPGCRFFCGCCGEILCILEKPIEFPFQSNQWEESCREVSFKIGELFRFGGLRHITCGHLLFSARKDFGFIHLDVYMEYLKTDLKNRLNADNPKTIQGNSQ